MDLYLHSAKALLFSTENFIDIATTTILFEYNVFTALTYEQRKKWAKLYNDLDSKNGSEIISVNDP